MSLMWSQTRQAWRRNTCFCLLRVYLINLKQAGAPTLATALPSLAVFPGGGSDQEIVLPVIHSMHVCHSYSRYNCK